jgi:hypothetical protein
VGSVVLARPGTRQPLGLDPAVRAAWALGGETLLVATATTEVMAWIDGEPEPWVMDEGFLWDVTSKRFSVAGDDRHVVVAHRGALGFAAGAIAYDVVARRSFDVATGVDGLGGGFAWIGNGPDILGVSADTSSHDLPSGSIVDRFRDGRERVLLTTMAGPAALAVAPGGAFVVVEDDQRWQLYRLGGANDDVLVVDEPKPADRRPSTWSHAGTLVGYAESARLMVRDVMGAVRWEGELANATHSPIWSPIDDRFLTRIPCDTQTSQVHLVDPSRSEHTTLTGCESLVRVDWAPRASALLAEVRCEEGESVLHWIDPTTGRSHRVTECGVGSSAWSPDGTTLAVIEPCDAGSQRVRFFDEAGEELGHGSCAEGRHSLVEWSPDSDVVSLVVGEPQPAGEGSVYRARLMRPDGRVLELGTGWPGPWRPGPVRDEGREPLR